MTQAVNVALIGCGVVGTGTARILLEHAERLTRRAGRAIALKRVVVRNADKLRDGVSASLIATDIEAAVHDPTIDVVVELIGGTTTARRVVLDSLAAGKHVVTANKALLAEHGPELF